MSSTKMTQKIEEYQVPITIGTIILVGLFLITTSYSYAKNEAKTLEGVEIATEKIRVLESNYTALYNKQESIDKNYVEIKTRLIGIESLMLEVRGDFKSHLNK